MLKHTSIDRHVIKIIPIGSLKIINKSPLHNGIHFEDNDRY